MYILLVCVYVYACIYIHFKLKKIPFELLFMIIISLYIIYIYILNQFIFTHAIRNLKPFRSIKIYTCDSNNIENKY